ncbi:hypothetical protein J2T57_003408 [Natronocella acetinitrilica]|uniref:Glutaredoxin family protein n=1 Tax=Natronocella acetinitrilica TaxID=414046 RepID=A0AAE3KCZ2_9GAMM|nr:glutaredoxin family protein [Natronocella acetinitrilica]MCP1676249.1 hypothetical protein [Natronocella acetinitrilica]
MSLQLLLYGTDGCHLCEDAARIVSETVKAEYVTVQEVDIVHDEALLQRYGTRIPVLKRVGGMDELCWPFDHADVARLTRTDYPMENEK